jgi:ubiquinone/menaquinone biosynthesis C-methylase UbiE
MSIFRWTAPLFKAASRRWSDDDFRVVAESQMLRRVDADPLVSVRLARAEALPFPDSCFDAVLCCDAFHHFRDQNAAAGEMARVVRPGGGVAIMEMEGVRSQRIVVGLERLLGEPGAFMTATAMERFMKVRGITGTAARQGDSSSYVFVGSSAA